jgi:hypothetical protein
MLEAELRALIPNKVSAFAKLTHGKPYHFDCWRNDRAGSPCLYYWFLARNGVDKNTKRVPVSEFRAALLQLRNVGAFSREIFRQVCPTTKSDGECGFAVIGRIFEAFGVAAYSRVDGFKLTNADEVTNLLEAR